MTDKKRHSIQQFIQSGILPEEDKLQWYPAAPTTLEDQFAVSLDDASVANILLVGEEKDLRESIVVHSLCGFLMQDDTRVVVSVIDEQHKDRASLIRNLQNIHSNRLTFRIGISEVLGEISSLKKIRSACDERVIYLWYGLDKLKNEIFLLHQEMEEAEELNTAENEPAEDDRDALLADLLSSLAEANSGESSKNSKHIEAEGINLSFEDCCSILKQAFDMGPENGQCHFVLFNNRKVMKKSSMISLECFENRIGTRMSNEDSYELFDSSMAINKTDENTVIYYTGSGQPIPLRPYTLPDASWYCQYNERIAQREQE